MRTIKVVGRVIVGFNAAKSHQIVDMREDFILRPELFGLVEPSRHLLDQILPAKRGAELQMTLADQGVDLVLRGLDPEGLDAIEALTSFCQTHGLARLSIDRGTGPEAFWEPQPATVTLSGTAVRLPVGAFLQATADGETALVEAVREATGEAKQIADLFAGIGTFALGARARYGAEASRDAVLALQRAAPALAVEHRDLYRRPLDANELAHFDAVVLDPPRAGAEEQVSHLAKSAVSQAAYVSCNPATFARDAKTLVDAGYTLEWIKPVGQFRWSTHVELAAAFSR